MPVIKTPGVYIVEKPALPNSVVEVATAVPAFIGYTQVADNKGTSLHRTPWRISSMAEFQSYFGGPPDASFRITDIAASAATPALVQAFSLKGKNYVVTPTQSLSQQFLLYYSILLFFQNGGGPCYIVSVGSYADSIDEATLMGGIDLLLTEQEPTMVVLPDAVHLATEASCIKVQQAALAHCGEKTKSRVAILDVYDGYRDRKDQAGDCITQFRNDLGINFLSYAAAYYPWLATSILSEKDLNYKNLVAKDLTDLLTAEAILPVDLIAEVATPGKYTLESLNKTLLSASPVFAQVMSEVKRQLNVLPPSAAIAGVYSMVDGTKGVWKAPANVSLNSVVAPLVSISGYEQEDLNVDVQGKSVNVIRSFIDEGVLVWGARTLDGNSQNLRYINVRRTMIMLEQSIKLATKAYVFENNVPTTWVTIKSIIRNFLTGIWKRGGLAGATSDDAFGVFCGLGETMTADDILSGILRVTVLVAITRPAEFSEITFQQQMPNS
jgi:hypothetical protein